jgi:hypothetical protein
MRVNNRLRPFQLAVICGFVALGACASAGQSDLATRPSPFTAADVMTEAEITGSHGLTAYDAIQQSRPRFLTSRIDVGPFAERAVYLNGILIGGLSELRGIPASSVREIRFFRAIDAPTAGIGRQGGGILVISKAGR